MSKGNIANIYPLSPMQEGLLFHTINAPTPGVYVNQVTTLLDGHLDIAAFRQAWEHVTARHDVLRTLFTWEGRERPLQIVRHTVTLPWVTEDWRALSPEQQQTQFAAKLRQDRAAGFDITKAPLMRFWLAQLTPQRTRFLWTSHHLVFDGWSTYRILGEVFDTYAALKKDQQPPAPPTHTPQFVGYIRWQQQQDMVAAEHYWREALAGYDEPVQLQLPNPHREAGYQQFEQRLSPEVTQQLGAFAQAQRLTLGTMLQGAWGLLLSRYSGRDDVAFGLTVSGRPPDLAGAEEMIGLFINTLPLRATVTDDVTVTDYLHTIQQRAAAMREFEHTPLTQVQRWSDLPPGQNLFDTILVIENYPVADVQTSGATDLTLRDVQHREQSNFPLAMIVLPGDEIEIIMIYDREHYATGMVQQIMTHFTTILRAMVEFPTTPIGTIDLLPPDERHRLLIDWNATATDFPREHGIHHLIESHVSTAPDAPAVIADDATLTYADLNQRANQLAQALRREGLAPGEPVALLLNRTTDMIVGILGVLKAGGAYVPLDPAYPAERIAFVLDDLSNAHSRVLLVTDAATVPATDIDHAVIRMSAIATMPTTDPNVAFSPQQRAYIIYTSGSTGQPKGVEVTHRQLVHSTTARETVYDEPFSSFLLLSSYAFDSSLVGIFWTLCSGAALVIPPNRIEQDIAAIEALVAQHKISHLLCVPSLYQLILEFAQPTALASLRVVMVAGEACPPSLVTAHHAQLPTAHLYNEYGPTEGTVWSIVYRVPQDDATTTVPIGRPIPNMRAYILDAARRPVPVGVPGELYIAGEGVALGYFDRPDLTAERFITHTFADSTTERLYRTGDRVRYLPDANIEFLGRADFQVKVRGFRVELGEIEARLSQHPAVLEAVVVTDAQLQPQNAAPTQLIGYVRPGPGTHIDDSDLRGYLRAHLPDYMVPSIIVVLDDFPRTATGKVDRRALPPPTPTDSSDVGFVAAVTPTEQTLAEIWATVLKKGAVGVHDNFFEIGGDSLLSIQIAARARRAGYTFRPNDLFDHPTIAELAAVIQSIDEATAAQQHGLVVGTVPLTPIQGWFFSQGLNHPHQWNQTMLLRSRNPIDDAALRAAAEHILRHHDALRTRFVREGTGWQQEFLPMPVKLPLTIVEVETTAVPATAIERHCDPVHRSFDLARGGLFHFLWVRSPRSDEPGWLALIAHHLVVDAVSWGIILEDFQMCYGQAVAGQSLDLPAKTASVQAWSEYLSGEGAVAAASEAASYWSHERYQKMERLPADFPDEAAHDAVATGEVVRRVLPKADTHTLLEDVPGVYHTRVDENLLTALAWTLHEWLGGASHALMLEGHGREPLADDIDLLRTVGWFTSTYPLVLHLPANADPGKQILSVKEQVRGVPWRGVGYGLLRYTDAGRSASANSPRYPEPEFLFNYLGHLDDAQRADSPFEVVADRAGQERHPADRQLYRLELNCFVRGGGLHFAWRFNRDRYRPARVEQLADRYIHHLQALIEHCTAPDAGGYSPSDFSLATLDDDNLSQIASLLDDLDE